MGSEKSNLQLELASLKIPNAKDGNYMYWYHPWFDPLLPILPNNPPTFKILYVIYRETVGWRKSCKKIPIKTFKKMTGLSRPTISRGLTRLRNEGIILMDMGYRKVSTFAINWNYKPKSCINADIGLKDNRIQGDNESRINADTDPVSKQIQDKSESRINADTPSNYILNKNLKSETIPENHPPHPSNLNTHNREERDAVYLGEILDDSFSGADLESNTKKGHYRDGKVWRSPDECRKILNLDDKKGKDG